MFEIALGVVLVASHAVTVALIVLWFGLRKPKTAAEFWSRFRKEFLSLTPTR